MIRSSNGGLFFSKIRFRKVFYLVYFTILSKYYRVRLVCKSRRLILDFIIYSTKYRVSDWSMMNA